LNVEGGDGVSYFREFAAQVLLVPGENSGFITAAQRYGPVAVEFDFVDPFSRAGDISPAELVERTISYAKAKVAYFNTLRAEIPEMTDIATGRRPRPSDLDKFPTAFSVAGEKQEKAADKETSILLQRFSGNPGVENARAEFGRAQEVEERFHHDFDGVDFTGTGRSSASATNFAVSGPNRQNRTLHDGRTGVRFPGCDIDTAENRGCDQVSRVVVVV
jgi:hypothetical protein